MILKILKSVISVINSLLNILNITKTMKIKSRNRSQHYQQKTSKRRKLYNLMCCCRQNQNNDSQFGSSLNHYSKSSSTSRIVVPPMPTKIDPFLLNINNFGPIVTYKRLHPAEYMYKKILSLITNEYFIVDAIEEVSNPFLWKAFQLKKEQKERQFGEVFESLLFHGTKRSNVDSICTFNFDWRLYGSNKGHKYGKGVSFSTNAKYASNYSDRYRYFKVMIMAKVLISRACNGHQNMDLPPPGYDTSQKNEDGIVVVKYEDNEFYPAYKLYYHFEEESDEDYYYPNYYNNNNYCNYY